MMKTYKYCAYFLPAFDVIAIMNKLGPKNCATCILQRFA
jgi:hypothetical protein